MTTPPFISACLSMMESEVGEPRRVGGPTRHSVDPMRRGALFLASFLGVRTLWARATSCWRPNTTWRSPNTTWRARFTLFWGGSAPLGSCHVVLEAQRVMAGSLCDMAHSFTLFLGGFGPLGSSHVVLEAQHDMAGSLCDVARSFCSLSGGFGRLDLEPRRVGGPTRHGGVPIRRGRAQYNATRLFLGTSTKKPPPS